MTELALIRTVWDGVAGSPYYSTMAVLADGPVSVDSCKAALAAFLSDQASNIDTRLTATIQADVPIIDDATGTLVGTDTVSSSVIDMTGAGDILPPTTQGLVQIRTAAVVAGRRLRGRMFLPGMTEANNSAAGVPSGALIADTTAAAEAMRVACGGSWVIWSRTHGTNAAVTAAQLWTQWSVLRSRRD